MWQLLQDWYKRYFSRADHIVLLLFLIVILFIITILGNIFAPLFVSLIIAYLMDWMVNQLEKIKIPHIWAVSIVFVISAGLVLLAFVGLIPLIWRQLSNFFKDIPHMVTHGQTFLQTLPQRYPSLISTAQIQHILTHINMDMNKYSQVALTWSIASIKSIIIMIIYLVLVPLLVFFLLKDRDPLKKWFTKLLPPQRRLIHKVWDELHIQIGNYVRGKTFEIIIVGLVAYIAFALLGLHYAVLMGVAVGLSVIVPYIGAIVVTIPVVLIGVIQWGFSIHYIYLLIVYASIITLDANVLVPLLFSEAVSIHPIAIIVAVLFFGGIWGFWGIFFAIPLASLVKAVWVVWFGWDDESPKNQEVID